MAGVVATDFHGGSDWRAGDPTTCQRPGCQSLGVPLLARHGRPSQSPFPFKRAQFALLSVLRMVVGEGALLLRLRLRLHSDRKVQ